MSKYDDFLFKLGLSEIEAKLYLSLVKHGPATIKDLAEHAGFNRVTTHFQINGLIGKGLVVQQKKAARRTVVAENPDRLEDLLKEKEESLQMLKKEFPEFVSSIKKNLPNSHARDDEIEVKFYKGKHGVRLIYKDALKAQELRAYVNANEIMEVFPENMHLFIDAHNKQKEMKIWEILNKSDGVEKYTQKMGPGRYFYKFVPKTINLSVVDYMIYDGKVAIVNIRENPTGMIIINKDYYENAKAIFNFVWEMISSKPQN